MTDKVAAIIVNFNMPERTNALAEHIRNNCSADLYVIDNGSDLAPPSLFTNVWIKDNVQTTAGWLAGLEVADKAGKYDYYWFLITSAEFVGGDPLTPMIELLSEDANAVGVHPTLTADSTTSWTHMITRGEDRPRRTWMIDNIASLWRADWFDKIGRFDPEFIFGWGIDLETCYLARKAGRSLWIHEGCQVKKITDIGYAMDRMRMTAQDRRNLAGENMRSVLRQKYGSDYWKLMTEDGVRDEWR